VSSSPEHLTLAEVEERLQWEDAWMTGQPKVYSGNRGRDSNSVEVRGHGSTRTRPLELRLDLFNHSPTGFEWGYGGSGPAQLALAILALSPRRTEGPPASGLQLFSCCETQLRRVAAIIGRYRPLAWTTVGMSVIADLPLAGRRRKRLLAAAARQGE
jgi:hypothetical protein